MVMRPTVQGALTLEYYDKGFGELDTCALVAALGEQVQAANDGDLDRAAGMLITQAHTLDAMFNDLARKAIKSGRLENLDTYMKLALRAQSQCRATLEALGELKNPRATAFVNQANIAHGPQQVNNVPAPDSRTPRARKTKDRESELLEAHDDQWLDPGTTGTAGSVDPHLAALGKVDRTEDG
jgi:hypothetical protein